MRWIENRTRGALSLELEGMYRGKIWRVRCPFVMGNDDVTRMRQGLGVGEAVSKRYTKLPNRERDTVMKVWERSNEACIAR